MGGKAISLLDGVKATTDQGVPNAEDTVTVQPEMFAAAKTYVILRKDKRMQDSVNSVL